MNNRKTASIFLLLIFLTSIAASEEIQVPVAATKPKVISLEAAEAILLDLNELGTGKIRFSSSPI
jgi:hypothetical protein